MPNKISQIKPPLGGLARKYSFQNQEDFTTYDTENVRPRDIDYLRLCVGSRPGLTRYATTGSGDGIRCNLLDSVTVKNNDRFDFWEDCFQFSDFSHYSQLANVTSGSLPTISDGRAVIPADTSTFYNLYTPAPSTFDATSAFRYGVELSSGNSEFTVGTKIRLYFRMASNDSAESHYLEVTYPSSSIARYRLYRITGGVTTTVGSLISDVSQRFSRFEIEISGTSFKFYHNSKLQLSTTLAVAVDATTPGLGFYATVPTGGTQLQIARIFIQFKRTSPFDLSRNRVVYASEGIIHREGFTGEFTESSALAHLASGNSVLSSAESGQKLFIMDDNVPVASGTDGILTATTFDAPSVSSWTGLLAGDHRSSFILLIDPLVRQPSSGLVNTKYYYRATSFSNAISGGYFGQNPTVTVSATNGTFTLSGTTDLTFSAGDGTADATMTFSSSASTPEARNTAVSNALENSFYDATSSVSNYAELSVSVSSTESPKTYTFILKNDLTTNGNSTTGNPVDIVTQYEIDAASSGNLTIHGGPSTTYNGVGWSLVRCPKVYDILADEEAAIASGTDGAITLTNTFDSATYSNWETTLAGKDITKYSVVVDGEAYPILSVAAGGGTLGIGTAPNGTGKTFSIRRNDALVRWRANRGFVPLGSMVARYQDRLVVAGMQSEPNNWAMSRQGDAFDFEYTDADVGAAVKGALQPAGKIYEPITALMPYNDDNFFFGCRNSLWILRGNPAGGGKIDNVSYKIGVMSRNAWCHGPMGELVWISRDGMWSTNPTCMECEPVQLSEKLPLEFNLNPEMFDVSMAYDQQAEGIHVYLTPKSSSLPTYVRHWFLHWPTKSFWPVSFGQKGLNPVMCKTVVAPSPRDSGVLMASFGGHIYRHENLSTQDEWYLGGESIDAYLEVGPLMLRESGYYRGVLRSLEIVMADYSGSTTWTLYKADTAESVAKSTTAFRTGTFSSGRNTSIIPLMGGGAWRMRIAGTGKWAFVGATAMISSYGKDKSLG